MFGQVVSSGYLTVNITSGDKDQAKNPQSMFYQDFQRELQSDFP